MSDVSRISRITAMTAFIGVPAFDALLVVRVLLLGVLILTSVTAVCDFLEGKSYLRDAGDFGESATRLRLVDVLAAKISLRLFRVGLSPQVAAQRMRQQHGSLPQETPLTVQ